MRDVWDLRNDVHAVVSARRAHEVDPSVLDRIAASPAALDARSATGLLSKMGTLKVGSRAQREALVDRANGSTQGSDVRLTTAAMKAAVLCGEPAEALERFASLDDGVGAEKTGKTYDWALAAHAALGDGGAAEALLDDMEAAGAAPNAAHFARAIQACAASADDARAERLLERMTEGGVWPDRDAYCALVEAYARARKWEQVQQVADSMLQLSIRPTQAAGEAVVEAHAARGDAAGAQVSFDRLKRAGFRATQRTFKQLMLACFAAEDWERTLLYFEVQGRKTRPDEEAFGVARDALRRGFEQGAFGERTYQQYVQTLGLGVEESAEADLADAEAILEAARARAKELGVQA
jgi:hypothetical protein